MVREAYLNKAGNLRRPPVNPQVLMLTKGLTTLEGEVWAQRRRIITSAFHLEKLKGMVPSFMNSCVRLIKRWDELSGATEGFCELDVSHEFQNLTADVISQTAFGSSFEEGKRIFQLQREQVELVMEAFRMPYIPGFRFIPTAKNKRRVAIDKEIRSMLRAIIDKKLKLMEESKGHENTDLLGLLLQFASDEKNKLTIENVIEECKLFYFAGHETTSTLLTWTVILLSMHPMWQQRARDEVLGICGKNKPDFESINQLKTVSMIMNEVLRLYPSVPALFRETCSDLKLGELTIPAGVGLLMPILLMHHDPEYWGEDADEFKPERFSEGISKAAKIGGQSAYFPFGLGPKMCVGQNFALIEAKMALAMILQHFSFELSPSYTHAPYVVITIQPQHGAHLILHRL